MHGINGMRGTWRKVPRLVDRETGAVLAVETMPGDTGDCTGPRQGRGHSLVEQLLQNRPF